MGSGIVLKCAASGARLPWVQVLSLSLQFHELEHITFLFLSFLILKMGTIIVPSKTEGMWRTEVMDEREETDVPFILEAASVTAFLPD